MAPFRKQCILVVMMLVCAVALSCGTADARIVQRHSPQAPNIVWPDSYTISYEYSLPYVKTYQAVGLTVPCTTYLKGDKLRLDTYGAESMLITTKERDIEVVPRLNETHCLIFVNSDAPKSHTVGSLIHGATPVLPDISKWPYLGMTEYNGETVHLFHFEEKHGEKIAKYSFYIREDKSPLRLHQHGPDLFSGSHFDEWIIDFKSYIPHEVPESKFEVPELCEGVQPANRSSAGAGSFALRMRRLLPGAGTPHGAPVHAGGRDPVYDAFAAQHGREHADSNEYHFRLGVFHSNLALINTHNAQADKTHTLAANRFTDWTEEEFLQVMLPNHGKRLDRPPRSLTSFHRHDASNMGRVPKSLDWSGTGADGVVKDQSACGSCWAFGAAGAAQAAWFMATGEAKLLSEQQLMDCSWGHTHNKACDGGLAEGAYKYLIDGRMPLAELDDYPYRGQDSFCRDNATAVKERGVRVKGFKVIRQGDTDAVKEALYSKGPLTVSIDAGNPSFRFYSSGVYDEPACKWKQNQLDHSVMLVGYGSTRNGKDFWTIKNSWSTHWGNQGYIHISRDHHACGIASDAIYATVDTDDRRAATAQQ